MAKSNYRPVKYAIIDAFADSAFKGNPAAVCLLEEEREESWLQSVASEFNISETCYLTRISKPYSDSSSIPRFNLRWFTPVAEVELCGHATLAASHFCFTSGLVDSDKIEFSTLSGILKVKKVLASEYSATTDSHDNEVEQQFFIELDFPTGPVTDYNSSEISVAEALGDPSIVDLKKTRNEDILVVLPCAAAVADLQPQFEKIVKFPGRGVIVSSLALPESEFDFVSRFFCPKHGINEKTIYCAVLHPGSSLWECTLRLSHVLVKEAWQARFSCLRGISQRWSCEVAVGRGEQQGTPSRKSRYRHGRFSSSLVSVDHIYIYIYSISTT